MSVRDRRQFHPSAGRMNILRIASILALAALLAVAGSGCDSTTEPAELAGFYYAAAVNGGALPARRIEWFANSAGSCERDLDGADLMFSGETEFDLFLIYSLRCQGALPRRSHTHIEGVYTRNGTDLDMQPITTTGEAIREAEVRGRSVFIVIRRNETDFRLRFEPGG